MNKRFGAIVAVQAVLMAISGPGSPAWGQDAKPAYVEAPIERYLMSDQNAEIMLARSAAPPSISHDAEILVLTRQGYEIAAKGGNGFVCLVERSWMSPFDSLQFWNPRMRGPICYNPPAVQTVLPFTLLRTALVLAGRDRRQILVSIETAWQQGKLPMPKPGAMSYMMSREGYLGDSVGHWHPHLMFHVPRIPRSDARVSPADTALWGANLRGSPVMVDTDETEVPEPETIFMVAVDHWSDGTPAPMSH